jgi:pimeloyl-ACP methyl ester carboxylesterase
MKLYSQVSGNGRDLVLLTGLAGSTQYWNHVHDQFLEAGYRVIRLDLLGFGHSPRLRAKGQGNYTITAHVDAIVETLRGLNVQSATVVGYSMSCSLVLHLAARYPELCARAVLLCPPIYSSFKVANGLAYQTGDIPRWVLDSIYARIICRLVCNNKALAIPIYRRIATNVPMAVREDARLHNWKSYRESFDHLMLHYRAEADLAASTTPTHVVYGTADKSVEATYLKALAKDYSQIKMHEIVGGHHQLPNQSPDVIVALIAKA